MIENIKSNDKVNNIRNELNELFYLTNHTYLNKSDSLNFKTTKYYQNKYKKLITHL